MTIVSILCQHCNKPYGLDQLLFCTAQGKQHARLQCRICAREQVDAYLCYTCLDSTSVTKASEQRFSCLRCFSCPLCKCPVKACNDSGHFSYRCMFCYWSWERQFLSEQDLFDSCCRDIAASLQSDLSKLTEIVSTFNFGEDEDHHDSDFVSDDRTRAKSETDERGEDVGNAAIPTCQQSGIWGRWISPLNPSQTIVGMLPTRLLLVPRVSTRCTICDRYLIKPSSDMFSAEVDKNALATYFIPKIYVKNGKLVFENQSSYTMNVEFGCTDVTLKPYERIRCRRQSQTGTEGQIQILSLPWQSTVALPKSESENFEGTIKITAESCHVESLSFNISIKSIPGKEFS